MTLLLTAWTRPRRTGTLVGRVPVGRISPQLHTSLTASADENICRLIVNNAREGIWTVDVEGRTTFCNERMAAMLGTDTVSMAGRSCFEFVFAEDLAEAQRQFQLKLGGDGERFDFCFQRADGSTFWACVSGTAMRDESGALVGLLGLLTDISGRKQAEQELEHTRAHFRQLRASIPAIVWRADPTTFQFTFVSEEAGSILGYPTALWIQEPNFWMNHIHSEDREWAMSFCVKATSECRDHQFDSRMLDVHGKFVWMRDFVHVATEGGKPKELFGVMVDITARKLAERDLQQSQARLSCLTDSGIIGIVVGDSAGQIIEANDYFLSMLQYTREDLSAGIPFGPMTAPEYVHLDQYALKEFEQRAACTPFEKEIFRRDGSRIPVLGGAAYLYSARGLWIGYMLDMTEPNRVLDALRGSEERFRNAFAHAAPGMAIAGTDRRLSEVNAAYCEITGYSRAELVQMDFLSITHPDDRAENIQLWNRLMAREAASVVFEKRYVRKNGDIVWARNSVSRLDRGGHEPAQVIALVEDITERKRAEAALRELSAQLLRLQDDERRRPARQLHDSTAQDIAALGMNLEIVRESEHRLDDRARGALNESLDLAKQCVRDLRTSSYLLHPPQLDEHGLAAALRLYVEGFSQRSGIQVDLVMPPDFGRLPRAVETTLFRVVQEALNNIHRHSGSRTASISLTGNASKVRMEIEDHGRGMASEAAAHSTSRAGVHPGVGITSMQERVRQAGGEMTISSSPHGTVLRTTIPTQLP